MVELTVRSVEVVLFNGTIDLMYCDLNLFLSFRGFGD